MKIPKKAPLINAEKVAFLVEYLKNSDFKNIPSEIKASANTGKVLKFIEQISQIMPDSEGIPYSQNPSAKKFAWRIFHFMGKLNEDDMINPASYKETQRIIKLTEKAIKATIEVKNLGETYMFLPITSIGNLDEVTPYLGYLDDAERDLKIALKLFRRYEKWAYSSSKKPQKERSIGLEFLCALFEQYLGDKSFLIEAINQKSFEKVNSKNRYLATPLKLTTNAAVAMGYNLTEDTIRKRIKKNGGIKLEGI